jgi:YgiT-type zinc finger domain-containing protein
MSSSQQSSQSKKAALPCPTCGSRRVEAVVEDVVIRIAGVRHKVAGVAHERCAACGERIFNLEASKKLDAILGRSKRKRPSAA